jgi:hypothetical protein
MVNREGNPGGAGLLADSAKPVLGGEHLIESLTGQPIKTRTVTPADRLRRGVVLRTPLGPDGFPVALSILSCLCRLAWPAVRMQAVLGCLAVPKVGRLCGLSLTTPCARLVQCLAPAVLLQMKWAS